MANREDAAVKAREEDSDAALREEIQPQINDLGRRLLKARLKADLTQKQVGETLNVSGHSPVGQWERGEVFITTINVIALAELYKASLDWMVFGVKGTLEDRIDKLPDVLKDGVLRQCMSAIESAEDVAKKHGKLLGGDGVRDEDERLTVWSAAAKIAKLNAARKGKPKPRARKNRGGNA